MFLRRMGRKILLLQSARDGSGKVLQRRLGDFANAQEAKRQLKDRDWCRRFQERYPEMKLDRPLLLRRAAELGAKPATRRASRAKSLDDRVTIATRALRRLLEQAEDSGLRQRVLLELSQSLEVPVKMGRRACWDERDPEGLEYRQKLEVQRDQHGRLARWQQACEVQELLTQAFPGPRTWADFGALLQRLGRWEEAAAQYRRLPEGLALRHYQLASLLCARGLPEESLMPLLRAMTLDRSIADALVDSHKGREVWRGGDYWNRYGHCWNGAAREYFLAIYQQSLVKMALGRAQRLGTKPRRLFRECAYPVILEQARQLTSS